MPGLVLYINGDLLSKSLTFWKISIDSKLLKESFPYGMTNGMMWGIYVILCFSLIYRTLGFKFVMCLDKVLGILRCWPLSSEALFGPLFLLLLLMVAYVMFWYGLLKLARWIFNEIYISLAFLKSLYWICKLPCSEKVRYLLWLICHKALLTNEVKC